MKWPTKINVIAIAVAVVGSAFTPAFAVSLDVRINASTDDAEQTSTGTVNLTDIDLDIDNQQWIGLRFNNVTIPQGAYIISAYVTFRAEDNETVTTNSTIYGQAADNATTFTTASNNISSRARTSASVAWSMASWSSGTNQNTPEIRAVVQEIVNRSGWSSGNSLAVLLQSTTSGGDRDAVTYNANTTTAALLHVDYVVVTRPSATQLLFVVANAASLTAEETKRKTAFEAWGYTVTLLTASSSQATYDTAAAANEVCYISEGVSATDVNTKLKSKPLGIVNANTGLADDFAIASSLATVSATAINISSSSHFITSPWATGSRTLTSSSQTYQTVSGTLAGQGSTIATIGGVASLVTVEVNATLNDNTRAVGRRVQLPWGGSAFAFSSLNDDGLIFLSRCLAWAGGLVAYYKLDETSGMSAVDSSVHAYHGTYANSPTINQSAKAGTGVLFNGTSQYVAAVDATQFSSHTSTGQTVSAWVKIISLNTDSDGQGRAPIVAKGNGSAGWEWALYVYDNGQAGASYWQSSGSSNNETSSSVLTNGMWTHLAMTYQKGVAVKIYINGVLTTTAASFSGTTSDTIAPVQIARREDGQYINAVIDDVRIYNHPLDADEILKLSQVGQATGVQIIKWLETQ